MASLKPSKLNDMFIVPLITVSPGVNEFTQKTLERNGCDSINETLFIPKTLKPITQFQIEYFMAKN